MLTLEELQDIFLEMRIDYQEDENDNTSRITENPRNSADS